MKSHHNFLIKCNLSDSLHFPSLLFSFILHFVPVIHIISAEQHKQLAIHCTCSLQRVEPYIVHYLPDTRAFAFQQYLYFFTKWYLHLFLLLKQKYWHPCLYLIRQWRRHVVDHAIHSCEPFRQTPPTFPGTFTRDGAQTSTCTRTTTGLKRGQPFRGTLYRSLHLQHLENLTRGRVRACVFSSSVRWRNFSQIL